MSGFRVLSITSSFQPRHRMVALLINGVDAVAGDQCGTFELTVEQAAGLSRALDVSVHHAECLRRGVVPVTERTG
jgi:hypothetical protein